MTWETQRTAGILHLRSSAARYMWPHVETFDSYAENARCISTTEARYVVIQPDWITLEALPGAPGGGHPAAVPVRKLPGAIATT